MTDEKIRLRQKKCLALIACKALYINIQAYFFLTAASSMGFITSLPG